MGVQYLVVVDRAAPQPFARREVPVPAGALAALREQLDLTEVELNPGLVLFEVQDPWPLRSDITDLGIADGDESDLATQLRTGLGTPPAVLGTGTGTRFSGELAADRTVAQAETADPGWSLTVDGETAERSPLLGWQQQFVTTGGGDAELSWATPLLARGLQAIQVLMLVGLIIVVSRRERLVAAAPKRRRRIPETPLVVVAPDGEVLSADRDLTGGALSTTRSSGAVDDDPSPAEPSGASPDGPEGSQ